jgi:hypothetical protein
MGGPVEKLGEFELHVTDDGQFGIGYRRVWLPGVYADRDTALMVCGYVLGGERLNSLEVVVAQTDRPVTLDGFLKATGPDHSFPLRAQQ